MILYKFLPMRVCLMIDKFKFYLTLLLENDFVRLPYVSCQYLVDIFSVSAMLILLDIHQNILSAQGYFRCAIEGLSNVVIIIEPNKLRLSFCKKNSFHYLNITMPENFLLPSTVTSVSCKNSKDYSVKHDENVAELNFPISCDPESSSNEQSQTLEVTFRLQISNSCALKDNVLKIISDTDFKNFMHVKLKQIQLFTIVCTECGSSLTEEGVSFRTVKKYYEGMSEMAESWFCHKHGDDDSIQMDSNSLYIGDMHFYFHVSIIKLLMLSESNKEFKCTKCSSILSLKKKMDKPYYIGFFCDKIMLLKSETELSDIKNYKLDFALFSFCSVIQDILKASSSCKMYLQCKVGGTTDVLLLWFNSQTVVQFLLHTSDSEIPSEKNFNGKEMYKVLYCICPSDSELSKKWKHDFSVEFFQISDNMMNVVMELLQETSTYFPEVEKVKGFSIGYLPAYVSML